MQLSPRALAARRASGQFQGRILWIGFAIVLVGVPALGLLAGPHEHYALAGAGLVLFLGVLLIDVRLFPILAIPATLLVLRAGGASGLSASDLILFVGTLAALTVFRLRDAPEVRHLLLLLLFYQATTVLTVIYNPYRADIVEWVHEALLVGGSLIVGWVVARAGRAKAAITTYMVGSCFIALWACLQTLTHHFQPAYLPGGMQKNYIGDMLSFAVLLAYARPAWLGWTGRVLPRLAIFICLLGILSAQSKQAIISLAVGILFMVFRNRGMGRKSKAIFVALVPMLIIAYIVVSNEVSSHNRFNSVYTRLSAYTTSLHVWESSLLVGVGLRWWYTPRFVGSIQPPNAELEVLTSVGLIGLLGFFVLFGGALQALRKLPRRLGTLALAVLIMRLVQGQLDLFWVAAQGSLPWMIVGLILGVAAVERNDRRREEPNAAAPPLPAPVRAGP